jgi:hypothetical protein
VRRFQSYYWGVCPECGRLPDKWLNVGANHWLVCLDHEVRWRVGANLFSDWKDETEDIHQVNAEFLSTFRVVEPYYRPPARWEELRDRLRWKASRIPRQLANLLRGRRLDSDLPF